MKLLIVRHADAGDRDEFAKTGRPDHERPLSPKGHEQMRKAMPGLRQLVPTIELIATSPYARAVGTAEIVRREYDVKVVTTEVLEPESAPEDFEHWFREQPKADVLAVVGHEPHLGLLVSWLCSGKRESHIDFKKGGAALIAFDRRPKAGAGVLRWLMGPKELAALG
jgi:phosphohistidine phosphatase